MNRNKLNSVSLAFSFALGMSTALSIFSVPVQAADIIYNPPPEIAQLHRDRIGKSRGPSRGPSRGTSRGTTACQTIDENFALRVLVPGMGYTLFNQPTVYWSISQPLTGQFIFTLKPATTTSTSGAVEFPPAVVEQTVDLSVKTGIQSLPLKQYGVSLEEHQEYEWSVSLVCSTKEPSLNIFDTGKIKRVKHPAKMETMLKGAAKSQLPYIYAEMGFWYDALSSLSELIESQPEDKGLPQVRASFLKQGGFSE